MRRSQTHVAYRYLLFILLFTLCLDHFNKFSLQKIHTQTQSSNSCLVCLSYLICIFREKNKCPVSVAEPLTSQNLYMLQTIKSATQFFSRTEERVSASLLFSPHKSVHTIDRTGVTRTNFRRFYFKTV